VGTGQQHRRQVGVGTSRILQREQFSVFCDRPSDLVVERTVAGQDSVGEPSPQIGQGIEGVGHGGHATRRRCVRTRRQDDLSTGCRVGGTLAVVNPTARQADLSDADELARLRWLWRTVERGERGDWVRFRSAFTSWFLEHERTHVPFLAQAGGSVVGMAWLAVIERVPGPERWRRRSGDLQSVYVRAEHRNRGLGHLLISTLIDVARREGLAYLSVHPSPPSFPFYRRLGFVGEGSLLFLELQSHWHPESPGHFTPRWCRIAAMIDPSRPHHRCPISLDIPYHGQPGARLGGEGLGRRDASQISSPCCRRRPTERCRHVDDAPEDLPRQERSACHRLSGVGNRVAHLIEHEYQTRRAGRPTTPPPCDVRA
jgi:GNAT superfamily N-acetyltransferase